MALENYDDDVDLERLEPEERTAYLHMGAPGEIQFPGEYTAAREAVTVTNDLLVSDEESAESWLQYNGNLAQTGHSPADRITADNVSELSETYQIETESAGLQTNPIVIPGDPPELYFTVPGREDDSSTVTVNAVNARTGDQIWSHTYVNDGGSLLYQSNRGVVPYGDYVYFGGVDANIVAIDRESGEEAWVTSTMEEGQTGDATAITAAPLVYDGVVITGQSGDVTGWSVITGLDAETGEVLWQQRTVDKDGWVGETWRYSSSSSWMSPALDAESGTVFVPIANPVPMFNGMVRPGPNQHSDSLLAFDAKTGELQWANQFLPHELWDYDVNCTPAVFDMMVDGEERRVVAQDWKAGWTYILDAETGELLNRTEPFAEQGGAFLEATPLGEENSIEVAPSVMGGTQWPPDAYSKKTGLRYLGANNGYMTIWGAPGWEYTEEPQLGFGGTYTFDSEDEVSGDVVAQNPASGQTEWTFSLPDIDPDQIPITASTGGTTSTGGGIVFHGSSGGHMYALDDETGEELWNVDTGGRITASPVVWDDPDAEEQFVAVTSNDSIIVYSA